MAKLKQIAIDVVGWTGFWLAILGSALLVWPFYFVRNFFRLMVGGGYFPLGIGLIVSDQLLKWWAVAYLKDRPAISLIESILDLKYVENTGAAFGILRGQVHIFVIMAALTVAIIVLYLSMVEQEEPMVRLALVLILGGAVGNLIDRVFLGHVIDYVYVHYRQDFEWPVFNLADSIIDVGVGMILIDFVVDFFRAETEEARGEAGA